jgi:SAM domain (Sterile alpha motif)
VFVLSAVAVSPPYLCDVQRPIHSKHTLLPLCPTFIAASTSPTTSHHYLPSLLPLTKAIITDDITVKLPSNVSRWRTKHAQAWLVHTMELPQYLEAFKGASIDGMLLVNYVSESHLEDMIGTYSTVQYGTEQYSTVQ